MRTLRKYKLGEVINVLDSKRIPLSSKERESRKGQYPYYGAQGIIDYIDDFLFDGTYLLIAEDGENVKSQKEDIARIATGKYWVNNHAHIVESNGLCDLRYLCYLLNSTDISGYITGSAQPKLNQANLLSIEIELPSLEVQRKVADILSSFDDKIEHNNRINHNLEEQAQALYKSWFIDFEPFKDGKFVESELGMIPEGWRVGCYNDIISSTVSGDWGKDREVGNYTHKVSCIRGCDFADVSSGIRGKTPERFVLEKNFQNKRLLDKDIIVEISGGTPTVSTGRICLVSDNLLDKYSGNIVCTNFCRVIRPCSGYSSYVFYSWLDKYNSRVMFGYENGTSGIKNFQISDFMEKEPVIIPPQTVIAQFQTIVDVYQAVIQRNGNERMECETVRDALLPKLMSGEFKINDLTC